MTNKFTRKMLHNIKLIIIRLHGFFMKCKSPHFEVDYTSTFNTIT